MPAYGYKCKECGKVFGVFRCFSARIFLSIRNMLFLYELSNDAAASHPELHTISSDLFLLT
jgi:hypothetical protein